MLTKTFVATALIASIVSRYPPPDGDVDAAKNHLAWVAEIVSSNLGPDIKDPEAYVAVSLYHAHQQYCTKLQTTYSREVTLVDTEVPSDTGTPEELYLAAEQHFLLSKGFVNLPERQRDVILALYFEGLTYQEAEEALGLSRSTIERDERAALDSLRNRMA